MLYCLQVLEHPDGGSIIVMEYLDLHGLNKYAGQLGQDIARLVQALSCFIRFRSVIKKNIFIGLCWNKIFK